MEKTDKEIIKFNDKFTAKLLKKYEKLYWEVERYKLFMRLEEKGLV
jgi:hypothetical protein